MKPAYALKENSVLKDILYKNKHEKGRKKMEYSFEQQNWSSKPWKVTDEGITYGKEFYSYDDIAGVRARTFSYQGQFDVIFKNGKTKILPFKKNKLAYAREAEEAIRRILNPDSKYVLVNGQYVVHCKSCDKLSFYTKEDLDEQRRKAKSAMLDSIAGIGGAVGGQTIAGNQFLDRADRSLNSVRDFNICPHCGSRDIEYYNEKDYEDYTNRSSKGKVQEKDPIEEVKRFKELLDQGIITEEEFQKKKNELLGL